LELIVIFRIERYQKIVADFQVILAYEIGKFDRGLLRRIECLSKHERFD
jgi:hypothetical protein